MRVSYRNVTMLLMIIWWIYNCISFYNLKFFRNWFKKKSILSCTGKKTVKIQKICDSIYDNHKQSSENANSTCVVYMGPVRLQQEYKVICKMFKGAIKYANYKETYTSSVCPFRYRMWWTTTKYHQCVRSQHQNEYPHNIWMRSNAYHIVWDILTPIIEAHLSMIFY